MGYKYLLDLDGTGYSGRFLAFLASDSVPVKATVLSLWYLRNSTRPRAFDNNLRMPVAYAVMLPDGGR
ncbi:hypothetical protein B0H11DRAFT_2235902 [Mycena galericulata]|nr:hypothetical protein B0H11DRAFT_2235902 [Mycena galericulata]